MSKRAKAWKVGDRVLVPLHGVCRITSAQEEEILGSRHMMFELKPERGTTVVKIPASQMEARGIRRALTEKAMKKLLEAPIEPVELPEGGPHQRMRQWIEELRSGDIGVRRRILWQLMDLEKRDGKLTADEKDLRERLRSSFRREVELALDLPSGHAGRKVNQALKARK